MWHRHDRDRDLERCAQGEHRRKQAAYPEAGDGGDRSRDHGHDAQQEIMHYS